MPALIWGWDFFDKAGSHAFCHLASTLIQSRPDFREAAFTSNRLQTFISAMFSFGIFSSKASLSGHRTRVPAGPREGFLARARCLENPIHRLVAEKGPLANAAGVFWRARRLRGRRD